MSIDWSALRAAATAAARRAYAPYSGLRVGAAGQTSDGRVVTGCNVENVSYGLTLCAECGLVSALHATGPETGATQAVQNTQTVQTVPTTEPAKLLAVAVVAGDGNPLLPCGRCRQILLEAGDGAMLVDTAYGPVTLATLLPDAFTRTDLATRREEQR